MSHLSGTLVTISPAQSDLCHQVCMYFFSFLKGFCFLSRWSKPQWTKVHSAIVPQSFGTSVIGTCVKKLILGKNYDQKRRWGGVRRLFCCIIIWDHLAWDKFSECFSEGIAHAYIGCEFNPIGTRHLASSVDSTSGNLITAAECEGSQNCNSIFQGNNIHSPKSPVYPYYFSVRKEQD